MRIMINTDNDWYKVIWYVHNKIIYYHIYSSTHDVCAEMILPEQVLVHICDDNNESA